MHFGSASFPSIVSAPKSLQHHLHPKRSLSHRHFLFVTSPASFSNYSFPNALHISCFSTGFLAPILVFRRGAPNPQPCLLPPFPCPSHLMSPQSPWLSQHWDKVPRPLLLDTTPGWPGHWDHRALVQECVAVHHKTWTATISCSLPLAASLYVVTDRLYLFVVLQAFPPKSALLLSLNRQFFQNPG